MKTPYINTDRQELITKKEISKRLSCTQRTIDNLTLRGEIIKIKVGNLSRYDWNEAVAKFKAKSAGGNQ